MEMLSFTKQPKHEKLFISQHQNFGKINVFLVSNNPLVKTFENLVD